VWLDAARTSPYQFRQFWIQMADDDVEKYLAQFSLLSLNEITAILSEHRTSPGQRLAQRTLANEMTALVHGHDAARDAEGAADVLFGGDPTTASLAALGAVAREVPTSSIARSDLDDVFGLLARCGIVASTSEARRAVQQRGIRVNGVPLEDGQTLAHNGFLHEKWILLRKGKTTYHLLELGQ
jgi:tyrosyl-tRNA synthetase